MTALLSIILTLVLLVLSLQSASGAAGPEPAGWYAGDMHVHRSCGGAPEAVSSIFSKMGGQALSVTSLLADMGNGEVQDAPQDLPNVTGQDAPISTGGQIMHWDAEWHWDPNYFQFPHQALGGHVLVLGAGEAHQTLDEYTYPVFQWARQQNAIAGFAHMQYLEDGIPQGLNCCIPLEYPVEVALGAASFISEDVVTGNGRIDGLNPENAVTAYYRLLNCGFRPGFAAGTDYPCGNSEIGSLLTYVRVPGEFSYRSYIQGIAQGRTVVSRNGHREFLNLVVNGAVGPGEEVRLAGAGNVQVTVQWTSSENLAGTVELVRNGVVIASRQASVGAGRPDTLTTMVDFSKSGWLAARRMGSNGHQLHTAAVFITVNDAPVRASAADAQFFVQWIDNLLQKTSPGGNWASYFVNSRDAAHSRYQAAKAIYQQIAAEAAGQPLAGNTIWPATSFPSVADAGPDAPVELGVKFRADSDGYISGIRFYKASANTGTHTASLWTSSGTRLATAGFLSETAAGWQQADFSTPAAVSANTIYIASYHCPSGHYADDENYFAGRSTDNSPLHALADGMSGYNGVYAYGPPGSFPSLGWNSSNYWVDVVFNGTSPPPAVTSGSIWPSAAVPAVQDAGLDSPVELGVKFSSDVNGYVTGIRFFKSPANTGIHVGNLWNNTGQLLASAAFAGETASGWQQTNFAAPVPVSANTLYVASYFCPSGHYADDENFFSGKGAESPPLHVPADGASGFNGVYAYGAASSFPTLGWRSSNYWVDVVFKK